MSQIEGVTPLLIELPPLLMDAQAWRELEAEADETDRRLEETNGRLMKGFDDLFRRMDEQFSARPPLEEKPVEIAQETPAPDAVPTAVPVADQQPPPSAAAEDTLEAQELKAKLQAAIDELKAKENELAALKAIPASTPTPGPAASVAPSVGEKDPIPVEQREAVYKNLSDEMKWRFSANILNRQILPLAPDKATKARIRMAIVREQLYAALRKRLGVPNFASETEFKEAVYKAAWAIIDAGLTTGTWDAAAYERTFQEKVEELAANYASLRLPPEPNPVAGIDPDRVEEVKLLVADTILDPPNPDAVTDEFVAALVNRGKVMEGPEEGFGERVRATAIILVNGVAAEIAKHLEGKRQTIVLPNDEGYNAILTLATMLAINMVTWTDGAAQRAIDEADSRGELDAAKVTTDEAI